MRVKTKHFGDIEVDEKQIIDFPEGLPGFEDTFKFTLVSSEDKDSPFQWLQGIDNPQLAFVVINPTVFKPDYDIEIRDEEVADLKIKDINKVLVYSIVVVPEEISKMTANLKAPVLINTENMRGKQVILDRGEYKTKHFIIEELQKIGG